MFRSCFLCACVFWLVACSSGAPPEADPKLFPPIGLTVPNKQLSVLEQPAEPLTAAIRTDRPSNFSFVTHPDVQGPVLTPAGDFKSAQFSWQPGLADQGVYEIHVTAIDRQIPENTQTEIFEVVVVQQDQLPVITISGLNNPPQYVRYQTVTFTVEAVDADGQVSAVHTLPRQTVTKLEGNLWQVQWPLTEAGEQTLEVIVRDNATSLVVKSPVKVSVSDNSLPTIVLDSNQYHVLESMQIVIPFSVADADASTPVVSHESMETGVTLEAATNPAYSHQLRWTPQDVVQAPDREHTARIIVKAEDADAPGAVLQQDVYVHVQDVPVTACSTGIPPAATLVDQSFVSRYTADGGAINMHYQVTPPPLPQGEPPADYDALVVMFPAGYPADVNELAIRAHQLLVTGADAASPATVLNPKVMVMGLPDDHAALDAAYRDSMANAVDVLAAIRHANVLDRPVFLSIFDGGGDRIKIGTNNLSPASGVAHGLEWVAAPLDGGLLAALDRPFRAVWASTDQCQNRVQDSMTLLSDLLSSGAHFTIDTFSGAAGITTMDACAGDADHGLWAIEGCYADSSRAWMAALAATSRFRSNMNHTGLNRYFYGSISNPNPSMVLADFDYILLDDGVNVLSTILGGSVVLESDGVTLTYTPPAGVSLPAGDPGAVALPATDFFVLGAREKTAVAGTKHMDWVLIEVLIHP